MQARVADVHGGELLHGRSTACEPAGAATGETVEGAGGAQGNDDDEKEEGRLHGTATCICDCVMNAGFGAKPGSYNPAKW